MAVVQQKMPLPPRTKSRLHRFEGGARFGEGGLAGGAGRQVFVDALACGGIEIAQQVGGQKGFNLFAVHGVPPPVGTVVEALSSAPSFFTAWCRMQPTLPSLRPVTWAIAW